MTPLPAASDWLRPPITLLIPTYNEAHRLKSTLAAVIHFIKHTTSPIQVLIVDDGSDDDTVALIKAEQVTCPEIQLACLGRHQGKGAALRHGLKLIQSGWILMMDADLAVPLSSLDALLVIAHHTGADLVVGTRFVESRTPMSLRTILRRGFQGICGLLLPTVQDTQCPFKLIRADAVRPLLPRCQENGFCFDVELLAIALSAGLKLESVPLPWVDRPGSRLCLWRDPWRMLWDLTRVTWRNNKRIPRMRFPSKTQVPIEPPLTLDEPASASGVLFH